MKKAIIKAARVGELLELWNSFLNPRGSYDS